MDQRPIDLLRADGRAGYAEPARPVRGIEACRQVTGSERCVPKGRVTGIPAGEATIGASNRIRGVIRTRTTVVLSTTWEGRHG